MRDLEQGVEQMKRLPSQAVVTELEPGEEPDTSNVKVLRKAGGFSERLRGGATFDNSGTGSLGKTQFAGYLIFDNPFGLNDIVSVSANSNVENLQANHRSQSLSLNYSIPWGYNTFTFSQSYSRYAQLVQGTTVQFLSSGRSENSELRWHRTIVRTDVAKAGLYGAVSTRRANSFLDDVELVVQRRRTTNLEVGLTYRQLFGDASLDMEIGYRTGVPWQKAQEDLPSAGNGGLTLRPDIVVFSGAFSKPFRLGERPLQYTISWRGQTTHATTLSVDQIAIGSRYSVRGFDGESVLLAESGYFVRNELSTPLSLIESVNTAAYVGMDFGRVWGPSAAALVGDRLAGAALGMRGQWRQFQFDLALATPLYKPSGFRTQPWNAYFSATYAF